MNDSQALVIDLGSGKCKCGFSGEDEPRGIFTSVVGFDKSPMGSGRVWKGYEPWEIFVGDEAIERRGMLKLKYPIEHGVVTNWNDFELIMKHSFEKLRALPEEQPLLITEVPRITEPYLTRKINREKTTNVLFEKFKVPSLYIADTAVLSIMSTGRSTGMVLNSGHRVTHSVPIYESQAIPHATNQMNIAGHDVTERLVRILSDRGIVLTTSAEREIVNDMKEKMAYISSDYQSELWKYENSDLEEVCQDYELPDGSRLKNIGKEKFCSPEIMFKPSLIGSELSGIHEMIYNSIQSCDVDLRKEMFMNIVLSGGNTLFKGIVERLTDEIQQLEPKISRIKVNASAERILSAWIGGSIITSLPNFGSYWITKKEFEEYGGTIVERKCV